MARGLSGLRDSISSPQFSAQKFCCTNRDDITLHPLNSPQLSAPPPRSNRTFIRRCRRFLSVLSLSRPAAFSCINHSLPPLLPWHPSLSPPLSIRAAGLPPPIFPPPEAELGTVAAAASYTLRSSPPRSRDGSAAVPSAAAIPDSGRNENAQRKILLDGMGDGEGELMACEI